MKHSMPIIGIVLSLLVVLLLRGGIAASASEAPVNSSNREAQPAETGRGEKTAAAEQITLSADRTTATTSPRSAPILISAVLNRADNPVPDGTAVDFAISSGSGTLSGATTTVKGVSTVRLSSTTVGPVIVSARAGSASAAITASFQAQPKQAIVKVATSGTLTSGRLIGGLLASVTYPVSGYAIASGDVTPSGVAGGTTTTLATNVETAGLVIMALFDVNGIQTGEFATLTYQVSDGYLPSMADFAVTPAASVYGVVSNAALPGIGVAVQSLTLR